jgi:hypothetical protein
MRLEKTAKISDFICGYREKTQWLIQQLKIIKKLPKAQVCD